MSSKEIQREVVESKPMLKSGFSVYFNQIIIFRSKKMIDLKIVTIYEKSQI